MSLRFDSHPDANLLAGFVEGRLDGEELREVSAHVEGCRECLEIAGGTAAITREAEAGGAEIVPFRRRWVPLAAAAALAVAAGLGWYAFRQTSDPVEPLLVALGSVRERPFEARVSGAGYAPYVVRRSDDGRPADPASLRLAAAAGSVLETSSGRNRASHQHAAGLAALASGDLEGAERHLDRAASLDGTSSRYWSDLAAARYERAKRGDEREKRLALALEAAEQALRRDGRNQAALFNRALILEALRRDAGALAAWNRARRADPASPWADEARRHAERLRERLRTK